MKLLRRYNTQSLLRELRYDPRLRILTTFPVAETEQLRHASPAGRLPGATPLSASNNLTLVATGANQTELHVRFALDPWPTVSTKIGVNVMTANDSSTVGIALFVVVYPKPPATTTTTTATTAPAKLWRATAWCERPAWGGVPGPAAAGVGT